METHGDVINQWELNTKHRSYTNAGGKKLLNKRWAFFGFFLLLHVIAEIDARPESCSENWNRRVRAGKIRKRCVSASFHCCCKSTCSVSWKPHQRIITLRDHQEEHGEGAIAHCSPLSSSSPPKYLLGVDVTGAHIKLLLKAERHRGGWRQSLPPAAAELQLHSRHSRKARLELLKQDNKAQRFISNLLSPTLHTHQHTLRTKARTSSSLSILTTAVSLRGGSLCWRLSLPWPSASPLYISGTSSSPSATPAAASAAATFTTTTTTAAGAATSRNPRATKAAQVSVHSNVCYCPLASSAASSVSKTPFPRWKHRWQGGRSRRSSRKGATPPRPMSALTL